MLLERIEIYACEVSQELDTMLKCYYLRKATISQEISHRIHPVEAQAVRTRIRPWHLPNRVNLSQVLKF